LDALPWRDVWLLDVRDAVLDAAAPPLATGRVVRARVVDPATPGAEVRLVGPGGDEVDRAGLGALDAAVMMAVPQAALPRAARWLLPRLGRGSVVFDIASEKSAALAALGNGDPDLV